MEKANQMNVLKFMVIAGVIASQIPVECHLENSFEIEKLDCTYDASYFNEGSGECALKAVDGRNKFVSGHGELTKSIDELKINVQVYFGDESALADGHFNLLFNISENLCHLAVEAKTSGVASMVRPIWQQYTNLPLECPVETGTYYLNDMDYNDLAGQFIPVTVPNGQYKIHIKILHKNDTVLSESILLAITAKKSTLNSE
ncbi:uncharacterized protein LOC116340042 [Contarinia nasturtii]|uniref:uncharacterized protein LOC116340042 n=1 Tax=Contarinia nasturtii TaxID=265458 RepID=UPI0012D3C247|nr:uncharacterized protein LOC116340042 [Contarinia nasturtii]